MDALVSLSRRLGLTEEEITKLLTKNEELQASFKEVATAAAEKAAPAIQKAVEGTVKGIGVPIEKPAIPPSPPVEPQVPPAKQGLDLSGVMKENAQAAQQQELTLRELASALGMTEREMQKLIDQETLLALEGTKGTMTIRGLTAERKALREQLSALSIGSEEYKNVEHNLIDVEKRLAEATREVTMARRGHAELREFRQEMRLHNYVLNQGVHSLTSLAFALSFLTQGEGEASESTKTLQHALLGSVTAIHTVHFTLFSLSQVAGRLPGVLGAVATSVSSMAGPIGIGVGALVALIAVLNHADEAAKKAKEEGIKEFKALLDSLAEPQKFVLAANIKSELEAVIAEIEKTKRALTEEITVLGLAGQYEAERAQMLSKRKEDLEAEEELLKGSLELIEEDVKKQQALEKVHGIRLTTLLKIGTEIQRQDAAIEKLRQEVQTRLDFEKKTALTVEEIREKTAQLKSLEQERKELLMSAAEHQQQAAQVVEQLYQLGKANVQLLFDALEAQRDLQEEEGDTNGMRQTELKLLQLRQRLDADAVTIAEQRRNLGLASNAEVIRALAAQQAGLVFDKEKLAVQVKINQELLRQRQQQQEIAAMRAAIIPEEREKALQEEAVRFEREKEDIRQKFLGDRTAQEEAMRLAEIAHRQKVNEIETKHADRIAELRLKIVQDEHAAKLLALDDEMTRLLRQRELLQITDEEFELRRRDIENRRAKENLDHTNKIRSLRIDTIANEEQRLTQRYEFERDLILQKAEDEKLREAELAKLRFEYENNIRALRKKELDAVLNLANTITQALHQSSHTFLFQVMAALQVIIRMKEVIDSMNVKGGGGGGGGLLDIFMSIFSLFTGGVGGSAVSPLIHSADEGLIVPGKRGAPSMVLAHAGEIILPTHRMNVQTAMEKIGLNLPVPEVEVKPNIIVDTEQLRRSNEQLVEAVRNIRIEFHNLLDGQTFLRKEFPEFDRFHARKKL
jgi:hypothetical protein